MSRYFKNTSITSRSTSNLKSLSDKKFNSNSKNYDTAKQLPKIQMTNESKDPWHPTGFFKNLRSP